MTAPGFLGERVREVASVDLAGHRLAFALYRFPTSEEEVPYLEISEDHPWYRGSRLVTIDTAVHALLNLGEVEIFQVGNRSTDWRGVSTEVKHV